MLTLSAFLAEAKAALSTLDIDDPGLEARMIVEHVTGTTRTDAIVRPDTPVSDAAATAIRAAIVRRLDGEPVHRIFGFRDFHGVRLELSPDTLEPRPDTETLVDAVLPFVEATIARKGRCRVLDLGTGTGAVAIAILVAAPKAEALATDIAQGALDTARRNAETAGLGDRIAFVRASWFDQIAGRFDAIVSNPPYIPSDDIAGLDREVRDFDPHRALDGGADGLDAYRAIAAGAAGHLEPHGLVAVEIGHGQRDAVVRIFAGAGFTERGMSKDLAGTERALLFAGNESPAKAFRD
ncbi:MAG: peptide chain release factor N(5)-glutamine methyltransferase [Rhizobiaceae bacterium]|nr:peptide chain release factor N(5)-glutamine methyltransferase [Rhizobiaceae bacterium]